VRTPHERGPSILSLSTAEIAYCAVVIVACYALRGSTGFGAAVAMPLLGLVVPFKVLIPAWTLIGLTAGIALFGKDRKLIAWGEMVRLVPTCIIGIIIGIYIFTVVRSDLLAKGLGALVLLYGCYALANTFRAKLAPPLSATILAPVAGLIGGITGAVFGTMASVFFAMYFDAIGTPKAIFRATMTGLLITLGVVRGIGYWTVDTYDADVMLFVAAALPMMFLGIFIGDRIHTGLSEMMFRRIISVALAVSGVALLVK
jgi:uncharacterized membrane protein YfcA